MSHWYGVFTKVEKKNRKGFLKIGLANLFDGIVIVTTLGRYRTAATQKATLKYLKTTLVNRKQEKEGGEK